MWPTAARRLAAELRNINPLFTRWQIINTEYQLILEVKSFYSNPGRGNVGFFLLNGTFRLLNVVENQQWNKRTGYSPKR